MGRGKSLKNVVDDAVWVWGGGWCGHTCAGAIVVKLPMMKKMTISSCSLSYFKINKLLIVVFLRYNVCVQLTTRTRDYY